MNLNSLLSGYNRLKKSKEWYDSGEWLSNIDIDHILDHVATTYPRFHHAGTYATDFQDERNNKCLHSDMCSLHKLPDIQKTSYISFVINTDFSSGGGIHWFCLFVDLIRMKIYVYDPSANPKHVKNTYIERLIAKIKNKYESSNRKMKTVYNLHQKQPASSGECGLYVTYFILKMIEFSEKFPFNNQCNAFPNTNKLWNHNDSWTETEKPDHVYKPWLDKRSGTLHGTKQNDSNIIFCGEPFFIFASNSCLPDMDELNKYMAEYIRTVLFCIQNEEGECMKKEYKDIYGSCSFIRNTAQGKSNEHSIQRKIGLKARPLFNK